MENLTQTSKITLWKTKRKSASLPLILHSSWLCQRSRFLILINFDLNCSVWENGVVGEILNLFFRDQEVHEEQPHTGEEDAKHEGEGEDESIFETNWDESVEKFEDLNLKEEVLRGIYGYGFERPSPIQQKAILPVLQGRDTIAQVSHNFNKLIFSHFPPYFNEF